MKFFGEKNLSVMDHVTGKILVKFDENGEAEVKDESLIERMKIYFAHEEPVAVAAEVEAHKEIKTENTELNIPSEEDKTEADTETINTADDVKDNTNEEDKPKVKRGRKKEVTDNAV